MNNWTVPLFLGKGTELSQLSGWGRAGPEPGVPFLKPETGRVKARKGRRWTKFSEPDTV